MKSVTVVVPTLNEAGNIEPLVHRVAAAFGDRWDWEILFVDDDSADGTAAEVERLAAAYPVRALIRKGERGLGSAVLKGFVASQSPIVAVMDADLSHPPEALPGLVEAVEGGCEVAIGSRYVSGGGTGGWSRLRWAMSRGATFLARGLTRARDPMAGFFCLRRSLVDGISLKVRGFKILLEILARARPAGVVEIPIRFAPRFKGKSKLGFGATWDYLRQLGGLYAARPAAQVLAFIAVLTALKVLVAAQIELDAIEAYHWLYAQFPALGYFDHPPMIGWWIWLSSAAFGDGLLGVRMATIVGGGLMIWCGFLAGRRLYGEAAGRWAALLLGCVPLLLKFSSEATPDAPLLLFWTATLWAMAHALCGDRPVWWYAAGFFLGLTMLSKYHAVFLALGGLGLLAVGSEHRSWLKRREPYVAAAIALLVFSPVVIWNARQGWQSFVYQGASRFQEADQWTLRYFGLYSLRQFELVTPFVLAWTWGAGLSSLIGWRRAGGPDRLNSAASMPLLLFFTALSWLRSVRAHWPAAGYLGLLLMTGRVLTEGGTWGRRLHAGTLAVLAAGYVAAPVVLACLPSRYLDEQEQLAREVRRLSPDFVIANDYHHAAILAYHLRPVTAWDFTPLGVPSKSFRNWWRADSRIGKNAVVVYLKEEYPDRIDRVREHFERVEDPIEVTITGFGDVPEHFVLLRARGYRP
ncbi:MAG: glycosyltransferase family 39 protein [Planctomycetes bacterium]|nr:glycosyltransferase family 39 protein [Planctomycetota bacterium]